MKNTNKTKYGVVKEWDFITVLHASDVYKDLIKKGYINAEGYLQEKFILLKDSSEMVLDPAFAEQQFEIHMTLRQKQNIKFTNEISEKSKTNKVKEDEYKFPRQIEHVLNIISGVLKFLTEVMENTANVIHRVIKLVLESIFNTIQSIVKWIARTAEITFNFVFKIYQLFWKDRKIYLFYLTIYIPSLVFYIIGKKSIARYWTILMVILTGALLILQFKNLKKSSEKEN